MSVGKDIVIIQPDARYKRDVLSCEKWLELIHNLYHYGYYVVQLGKRIFRGIETVDLSDSNKVNALFTASHLFIGSYNVGVHLAALYSKPAIVIWGGSDWRVFGYEFHKNLINDIDCRGKCQWCRNRICLDSFDVIEYLDMGD